VQVTTEYVFFKGQLLSIHICSARVSIAAYHTIILLITSYHFHYEQLTKVKVFSDCVNKAILDHPKRLIVLDIPNVISASLDTVLKKVENVDLSERRGDDADGEI